MCSGIQIAGLSVYQMFPVALLSENQNFVVENANFHHKECMINNYKLFNPVDNNVNNICVSLKLDEQFSKLVNNGMKHSYYKSSNKNKFSHMIS